MGYLRPSPCPGPTSGRNCYITPAFSGAPNKGDEFRIVCLTPTFSGAHKWAELLCNLCILSRSQPDWGAADEVLEEWWLKNTLRRAERTHKSQTAP